MTQDLGVDPALLESRCVPLPEAACRLSVIEEGARSSWKELQITLAAAVVILALLLLIVVSYSFSLSSALEEGRLAWRLLQR